MRLEGNDIAAGYPGREVLQAVRLRLESGRFVGLIGPNGCGKSTLLRVLSHVLPARVGSVQIDGQELGRLSPVEIARRLAFVPQQETPAFDFTVKDIVLMGRYPHRSRQGETAEDYALVARALADADVLHLAERPVTQLSGGELRRVLLARALAQQTPLLLLDEPTAHLDVTHQVELLTLTRRLTRERDVGALAALHELNQAAEFCDELVLLCAGRVLATGSPEAVLTADNLRKAYDAQAQIGRNPITGRPMLLTVSPLRAEEAAPSAPRVHVVCGGGSGVGVMGTLLRYGFRVTAGVLNRLDSDQEAAEALGIEAALEAPFSAIGADARARCAALMAQAQTIIVTSVPFGHGNLANLELVVEAQVAGKRVVLLGETPVEARDYASGAATTLLHQLRDNGALTFAQLEDWPDLTPPGSVTDAAAFLPALNREDALPAPS